MTIENELIELKNLQQALADFENDPDTEFMEPELANQIRNKYKTLISKRQRRAKRKENIANLVESANEAEGLYSQADEMDKFANASLPEQIARGSYSAAMKFDGGAAKMYGTGKKLAGFTARWLSDDQGAVADWGKEQMRQGTEFNAAVDDYIAKASGFNSEWADTDNAQLLSPSTWTPASVLKAGEGLMEFEAPMATVGLVSGAIGKTLNPWTRTAMEGAMIGVGNIPEHSDYIEQGSGKFKPKQAIASGLLSGELMSFAFLAGRGRGLSEAAAMNYAQQVGRTGVLGMGKQVFKEAALTGLANATLSGGVGGAVKEYFALPDNYTQKDLSNAIDRVFNQMGHEFVMGVGFGAHGAVKGLMEARSTYDRFVPKGSNKNIDTEVSKYFFGKEGQKILKENYPNLFAGEGSSADVNKFLEEVWNAIPNNLRAKNSSEMSGLFQNYRDALMAQWSMGKLEKTGIKNKIIEQFRAKMAQRISDALNAAQATQDQINNIDKQIQSKDTPLPQKQELAKQAEELRAQRDLDSEKIETPYTYDDLMETSLNMVINKYGADSSLADRTIRLVDELSAQHGREYDVETFANLLNQVDVFLGQGNAGKNMRDWLLNRQSAEPRTESMPESVLRQQNNNQDDTILPNTPGYGIEPNFSPIESNRPIMPEDVIASRNRENNRILSDKSATQSDIATQNPVYPSGGYSNEKGNPMKLFGQDRPNIGMPSSVKSESPVEPPAMSLKGKKLESPSTAMNKSQKSETLQTKGVNTEKGELKDRDMPKSVMTDRTESPVMNNERGRMGLNVEMKQKEVKNNIKTEKDTKYSKLANLLQKAGYKKGDEISKKELDKLARKAGFNGVENILAEVNETPFVNIGEIPLNSLKNKDGSSKMSETKYRIRDFSGLSEEGIKNRNTEYANQQKVKEYTEEQARLKEKYPILNDIDTNKKLWKALDNVNSKELQDILLAENGRRFEEAQKTPESKAKWDKEFKEYQLAKSETKPSAEKPVETSSIDEENRKAFGLSDKTPVFKASEKIGMDGEPEELQVSKDGKMATDNKMLIVMNEGESIPKSGDKEIRVMDDEIANGGYKRLLPDDGSTPRLDISIPYFKTKKLKGYRVSDIDLIAYPNGSVYLVNIENGNVMQLAGEKGMPMKNGRPADGAVLNGKSVETINKILGGDLKISHLPAANYPVVFEGKKGKAVLMPKYNDTGVRLLHEFANKKGVFDYTDKIKADKEYFDEISAKNKSYREGIASENAKAKEKKANEANDTKANLRNNHGVKFYLNNGEPDDSDSISDYRRQEREAYHQNTDLADIPIGKFKAVKGSDIPASRSQSGMVESTASEMYIYPNGTVAIVTPKEKGGTAEFINGIRVPLNNGILDRAFVVDAKAVEEASKILGGNLKIKGVAPSEGVVIFSGDNGNMTIKINRFGGGDSNYGDIKRNNIILESAAKKGLIDIADVNPGKMNEFLKEREKKLSSSIKEFKDKQNAKEAERLAKAKAEQEKAKAELEAENNSYGGFLDGKKPFQQGAVKKALDKKLYWQEKSKSLTTKEVIDELAETGKLVAKEYNDNGKKTYAVGFREKINGSDVYSSWKVGKTAYEYAKFKESRMGEDKLQSSRTLNRTANPVSDKELNNFLKGQAKQISKETGLNFKVVDSVDELRKMFPNNDITDTVEGGIHNDTVYLVKGNIDKDRLPLVIAHEVAGHRGVEALFDSKAKMDNFFNSLERAAVKDKFIRDAFAEVDRLGYKENRSREAMAKIVEKVRNESGTLKGTAKTFVNFISSRVRRLLRRMGFKNLQLNEAEVYDIAVQALRRTGLKNSNKFFGLDRFLAKDNSFLSATSTELDQKYPGWSDRQTTSTGRHSTQAAITEKTYKKIGDWILNSNLKNSKILDASSGMGLGTEALRKMGLNVDDIEPYPGDRKIKPTYSGEDYLDYAEVYKKHGKTYDLIISNAVLNVIPDDWRKAQLHAMADVLLNKGGKLIINVRGDKEVANTKNKIILDSPNEILLPNGNGGYRAYQKGFSQKEFQDWVSKELGAGYKVEKLTPKNSGLSSSTTGVIVTKEGGNGGKRTNPRYEEITKQLNTKQLGNREFNNKATELGALKTLQGTKIERYKKTVGKEVSGQIYVHKDYAKEAIPNDILKKAEQILSEKNPNFKYKTIMWDPKKGTVRFDEAPNFDTAPEPIPGKILTVNPITGETKETYSDKIWHHKWQWVKDDYKGFDTKESWERSREWLNGLANLGFENDNPDYSISNNGIANGRASGYDAWNKQLKYYGLDHLIDDKNNFVPKADIQFSIGERKVKPAEDVAKKTTEEIKDSAYPRKRNFDKAAKPYLKKNLAEFKEIFQNKNSSNYKMAALAVSYLTGYDVAHQNTQERFKRISDFNKLSDNVREYINANITDDAKRAKLLDQLARQKTDKGILDVAAKTHIESERIIRDDLLKELRQNLKDLKPNKISRELSMLKLEALSDTFTQEELDSMLSSNGFSTGAVRKMYGLLRKARASLEVIGDKEAGGKLDIPVKITELARELDRKFNESLNPSDGSDVPPSMKVSVEDLAKLNQVLADVKNQSKEAMKNLIHDASNEAYTAQEKIIKEMRPVDESIANSREEKRIGTYNRYGKPVNSFENLDLDNFSAEMGDTMNKYTHKAILEGQKTVEHYLAKGYREVDDIIKSFGSDKTEGMSNLEKSFMSVDTTNKHKYDITKDEAMAIYALATDRETKNLINKHGGLTLSLGDKKGSDTFILNADKLKDIESKLTTKEKELVMRGKKLLAQTYLPALNDVYERLNGVPLRLLVDGTYFPRTYQQGASEGSIKGIFDNLSQPYIVDSATGGYASFLKSRGDNVNLRLRGFTKTMESYVNQASNYIGMAEPLKKLNRILDNGMKKEIIQRYGVEYVDRLDRAMKLISGMGGKTREDQQTLSRYLSNLAAAKLTPMSALKQFSSVPLASSVIPYEYLAKGAVSGLSKENIAEMMELDAMQLRYRDNGIGGIMPLNATTREAEHNLGTFKNTKWNKLVNWGLNLSLMADKRALGIIYKATKLMAEAKGKGGDKAWIENKFMEAVRRTQNTTDLASAPGWQELARNSSTWAFINMYLNQTQKIPNEFLRLKRFMTQAEKKHGKDSAQYKEAKDNMVNFIMGAALMNAMTIGVGSLAGAALHKDDKKKTAGQKAAGLAADTLLNLTGNPVLKTALGGSGFALRKALPKAFGGEGMRSNVDTFGNDLTGIIPDTAYTFGKVFEDLNRDEPTARKFKKVTSDVLGSRAFESALAMGRIPTWFLRYPSQIWRNKLSDTESEKESGGRTGSGSWSLRRKRPTRRKR